MRGVVSSDNEWDRVATTRWGAYVSEVERRAILHADGLLRRPSIGLDLGCGAGRWSALLVERGWRMVCTDVNAHALDICRTRVPDAACILRSADERTLPCESDSIDLLLCIEVPPVMESAWFAAESARVLRRGGLLVAVCWNVLSGRGLFCHARAMVGRGADFYKDSYPAWKRRMSAGGFRAVYEEGLCWFPCRRNSNSPLVPIATALETFIGLRKLIPISPWVVAVLRKHETAHPVSLSALA
jgi:SAM-dependent methyltransferase